jgi:hypothetical protein
MKKVLLTAACATLGLATASNAAVIAEFTVQSNTPVPGWNTAMVILRETNAGATAATDKVVSAVFNFPASQNTGNRFMQQNFADEDTTAFTTIGTDFWSTAPGRGFANVSGNVTTNSLPTGQGAPPYSGPLPLPANLLPFDTHFLGDFNQNSANDNFQNRWFTQGSIVSTPATLTGTSLAFSGTVQSNPFPFAQLVYPSDKTPVMTIQVGPTDPVQVVTVPEPAALSLAGLIGMGVMARRRRD